jgi:hypothetical protein
VAQLKIRIAGLLCGGLLLLSVAGVAVAAPLKVGIRIEGASKTLVSQRTVTLANAPIVKDGKPSHSCPGQSALGAIQAGTKGDWNGPWSASLGDYFVNTIRGEKHTGSAFYSLWVNHKLSSTGVCETKMHSGDQVLLFVDRCQFDKAKQACKTKPITPLGLRVTHRVRRGSRFTLTVVRYTNGGRAVAVAGARIWANGRLLKGGTGAHGHFVVRATQLGVVSFYARHTGNAKSEIEKTRIVKP